MPRPRAPVPPDPERLATLLAAARAARTARVTRTRRSTGDGGATRVGALVERPRGWVPESAPPDADTSWLDDPWASESPDPGTGSAAGEDDGGPGEPAPAGRHRPAPRVLTVPTPFRGAHLTVRWRAVVGLLVVAVVAGLFFAVRVARAQQAAVPEAVPAGGGLVGRTAPPTAFGSGSGSGSASGSGSGSGAGASASGSVPSAGASARRLVVDVVGQVTHPGVVSVPDGSRVGDVLAAVGGALPGADVQRLNLARLVGDGEQIFVPRPGESPSVPLGGGGGVGSGAAAPATSSAVVDLNTATLAMLDGLPGVGPVLAQRILDWRTEHGRFTSIDELGEVSGIGDKLLTQIRSKVRV